MTGTPREAMTVLLADDHSLFREGVRALLGHVDGLRVVAETGDGHEALRLIEELRPSIAVLDLGLPGSNGLEIAEQVVPRFPDVRVVILSAYTEEEIVLRAVRIGVAGYLGKDTTSSELEVALRAVARGSTFMSPSVTSRLNEGYRRHAKDSGNAHEALTPRQMEVLRMIAEGLSTKEIAHRLRLSSKTVEGHRAVVMQRLGINNVAGLTRYALRVGLLTPDRSIL